MKNVDTAMPKQTKRSLKQRCADLGPLALGQMRVVAENVVGDDDGKYCIAEEFQALVWQNIDSF